MRRSSSAAVATLGVVGLVGLGILLVGWAADSGRGELLSGGSPAQTRAPTPTPTASDDAVGVVPRPGEGVHPGSHPVVTAVFVVLELALLAGALYVVVRLMAAAVPAVWRRVRWLRGPPRPAEVDFVDVDPPAALARAISREAGAQRRLLLESGSPRNAIVACWRRFEELAETAGLVRAPWETSSEFTLRVLDEAHADSAAVSRLAGLYREARFSTHPMGESSRAAAAAALDQVHQGLGAGAGPQ